MLITPPLSAPAPTSDYLQTDQGEKDTSVIITSLSRHYYFPEIKFTENYKSFHHSIRRYINAADLTRPSLDV